MPLPIPSSLELRPQHVLVASAEVTTRLELLRMVRGLGYSATECRDGRAAFRYVRQHVGGVAAILADLVMPLMDGGELAERVRDVDPGVRTVLLVRSLEGEAGRLAAAYADLPRLAKPVTFMALHAALVPLIGWPRRPGAGMMPGQRGRARISRESPTPWPHPST